MALLGQAALAMWWDVSAHARPALEHWHAHEHFAERLAIPGFLRASRWTEVADGEGFFVMYELRDHAVLASAPYVARLNAPSPWSTRMMPLHRNMVRTQCKVLQSHGAVTARHALTIRCGLVNGDAQAQSGLGKLAASVSQQPGIVGMHLLRHEAPALAMTTEQQIRGNADRAADCAILVCGYQLQALRRLADAELSTAALLASGAAPETEHQFYELAYSATPSDTR
ncbi:MAG: hypothetical protein HC793_04930 [Aquincola sp.]|nr:hypothetical protein [Aquincola sp.]